MNLLGVVAAFMSGLTERHINGTHIHTQAHAEGEGCSLSTGMLTHKRPALTKISNVRLSCCSAAQGAKTFTSQYGVPWLWMSLVRSS